jgi:hypothetical protein
MLQLPFKLYVFFVLFFAINVNGQITQRICGGIQYSSSLNNYGENSLATEATVAAQSIDLDNNGDIIVAHRNSNDPFGNRIRKIDRHTGIITSLAGCNLGCANTLGGPALSYSYIDPWCVSVDVNNDIYFLDVANVISRRVYKINATTLNIELVNGSVGIQADFISVLNGEVYYSKFSNQIYKINSSGIHELIAGTSNPSFSGDNSWAISATINSPRDIKVLPNGTIYFIDFGNKRIRKIENGIITTVAGNGNVGSSCSNCNPTNSSLQTPLSLDIDKYGNIYFVDYANIKKINDCDGLMYTIAGNGVIGITNSNMPPLQTSIYNGGYGGLCVDVLGNINFITKGTVGGSTTTNNHIYKIIVQATINNLAGNDYYVCHGDSVNIVYGGTSSNFNWGFGNGINPSFLVNSNFYLILEEFNNNGCLVFSDEIEVINVSLPSVVSVTDGYTCGIGTVEVEASATINSTINWYSNPLSTNILYQGDIYTTPILNSDSVFYAQAIDTVYNCFSTNMSLVNALITPIDSCTFIPDDNFENKLISAGIDDQFNNYVKTSMIDTLQVLDISNTVGIPNSLQISNLEGIQDFLLLKKIYATENNIDNIQLEYLYNRPFLEHYYLGYNNIQYFNSDNLAGLAVLRTLEIQNNNLTCLNLKNNATNNVLQLKFYGNPYLTCIQVDDNFYNWFAVQQSNTPVDWYNSPTTLVELDDFISENISEFCGTTCDAIYTMYGCTDYLALNYSPYANYDDGSCQYLGIEELKNNDFQISPNPNLGIFSVEINNKELVGKSYKIISLEGIEITSGIFTDLLFVTDINDKSDGVYFLIIDSSEPVKIIKQ